MADTPPDFRWAELYYPGIRAALLQHKATAWPEHTETNPHDPVIQLLNMYAMVGHQGAVRLDHAAVEQYLSTLKLRPSMVAIARLVGYELAPATPAEVDLVVDLTAAQVSGATVLRGRSMFGTEGTASDAPIVFEYDESDDVELTQDTGEWSVFQDDGGTVTQLSFPVGSAAWAGAPVAGDAMYFVHPDLQYDGLRAELGAVAADMVLRWEYYDDLREVQPDTVTDLGGTIRFEVDTLVGASDSTGLPVKVTCLRTGQSETVNTTYSSGNRITTAATLGQVTVSTSPADYLVQTDWPELPGVSTGKDAALQNSNSDLSWTLPQTADRRWAKSTTTVTATAVDTTGYTVRARVISVGTPTAPEFDDVTQPSGVTWSLLVELRQGETVVDKVGTTDSGSAGQSFTLTRTPFMTLTGVTVGSDTWIRVDDLLASTSFDRHFTLREQPSGDWVITFGDGTRGKIPGASLQVTATYRIGGDRTGNVGASAIARDRSGNTTLRNPRNPRAADGWVVQEASTPADLERARDAIPASLRTGERVVTPEDAETHAVAWRNTDGDQVAARALGIEEGDGYKTVRLVCVGPGGIAPTTADLTELGEEFNGETVGLQRVGGVALHNHRVNPKAFTPLTINVTATVSVRSKYAAGAKARIEAALRAVLHPLALELVLDANGRWVDGTDYQWQFGGEVSLAALGARIITAQAGVTDHTITTPASDTALGTEELPVAGTIAITIVEVST